MIARHKVRRLLALSGLLMLAGCHLPFWPSSDPAPHTPDPVSHWQASGAPGKQGPGAQGDAPYPLPQPRTVPPNEQLSLLTQRLASSEDDRKVLTVRLQLVEAQLAEKDKALAAATQEIQEATAQIVRTRNDLQQWKKEMTTLRDRLGHMEKDNKETLETIIRTLEQILEREKEPAKTPELAPALPLPKH